MKNTYTKEELSKLTINELLHLLQEAKKPKLSLVLHPVFGPTSLRFTEENDLLYCNGQVVDASVFNALELIITSPLSASLSKTGYNSYNGTTIGIGDSCYLVHAVKTIIKDVQKHFELSKNSK